MLPSVPFLQSFSEMVFHFMDLWQVSVLNDEGQTMLRMLLGWFGKLTENLHL